MHHKWPHLWGERYELALFLSSLYIWSSYQNLHKLTRLFNPFPPADAFRRICSRRLLKTLWSNVELLMMSNSSVGHNFFSFIEQLSYLLWRYFRCFVTMYDVHVNSENILIRLCRLFWIYILRKNPQHLVFFHNRYERSNSADVLTRNHLKFLFLSWMIVFPGKINLGASLAESLWYQRKTCS